MLAFEGVSSGDINRAGMRANYGDQYGYCFDDHID